MERKPTKESIPRPQAVDWSEVRRRLEIAQVSMERSATPAAEEIKRTLKSRAKALAREAPENEGSGNSIQAVTFLLAFENYAIDSNCVREVYPLKELVPLPGTPPFVLGVTSVRGQILSVIDLKKFFELPDKGLTDLNKVIVVRADVMEFGILADAILGTRSIPLAEIQPSLATLTGIRSDYLRGVTKDRLVVLDAARIVSDQRIIVREESMA
jgi:purine-binding chemotaxis protein CheW